MGWQRREKVGGVVRAIPPINTTLDRQLEKITRLLALIMFRIIVLAAILPISLQQLSCNTCGSSAQSSASYSNNYGTAAQRDDTSNSQPGYLPDYQGDRYTDPKRIADTQALNKEFFDSIGGPPSPPPLTPAQEGMNGSSSSSQGTSNGMQYQQQGSTNTMQYPQGGSSMNTNNVQYTQGSTTTWYQPQSSTYLSSQSYNPSSSSTSSNQQFYTTNPTTSSSNSMNRQYDSNPNSPYYYQRVPSTQEYNSILGINAGYPQLVNQQRMYDSNSNHQGMSSGSNGQNPQYDSNNNGQQGYPSQGQANTYHTVSAFVYSTGNMNNGQNMQQYDASNMNQLPQQYNNGYGNQQQQGSSYQSQQYDAPANQQYGSQSNQYSPDAISCCSQVSSTCCYQMAPSSSSSSSNVMYNPSVYQYGRRRR